MCLLIWLHLLHCLANVPCEKDKNSIKKNEILQIFSKKNRIIYLSIGRLWVIWTRLTLPDGILSLRNAAATPGTRFAVENNGRCSRVVFDADPGRKLGNTEAGDVGAIVLLSCWSLISNNCAIWLIFFCRAFVRPLVRRCLAAIHRMWSSNMNFADRIGVRFVVAPPRWMVICKQRESSLSPVTSTSWRNPTNLATEEIEIFDKINTKTKKVWNPELKKKLTSPS